MIGKRWVKVPQTAGGRNEVEAERNKAAIYEKLLVQYKELILNGSDDVILNKTGKV